MAGFVNEEHRAAWQPIHFRYEAEVIAVGVEWRAATKPLDDQLKADLEVEYQRHREANLALYAAHRAATKPIGEPFDAKVKALVESRDAELKAITAQFIDQF